MLLLFYTRDPIIEVQQLQVLSNLYAFLQGIPKSLGIFRIDFLAGGLFVSPSLRPRAVLRFPISSESTT